MIFVNIIIIIVIIMRELVGNVRVSFGIVSGKKVNNWDMIGLIVFIIGIISFMTISLFTSFIIIIIMRELVGNMRGQLWWWWRIKGEQLGYD